MFKTKSVRYSPENIVIPEFEEKTISLYFSTLNAGEYWATASLFTEGGMMIPPFDKPVVGEKNIIAYLDKEAVGLTLLPTHFTKTNTGYQVIGIVQTILFSVNVVWNFILNERTQIESVEIKLQANLEELLSLKKMKTKNN